MFGAIAESPEIDKVVVSQETETSHIQLLELKETQPMPPDVNIITGGDDSKSQISRQGGEQYEESVNETLMSAANRSLENCTPNENPATAHKDSVEK